MFQKIKKEIKRLVLIQYLKSLRKSIVKDNDFHGMCASTIRLWSLSYGLVDEFLANNVPVGANPAGYWWLRGSKLPRLVWIDEKIEALRTRKSSVNY